jgi:ABC-type multidrug transport system fused ATPase/permease subunit
LPTLLRGHPILLLAATVLAVTVARGLAGYGQRILNARLGQDVVRRVRERMYHRLLHAAPSVLVSQRRGEIATRIASDALQIQQLVSTSLAGALTDLVTLVGLAALAFSLDGSLTAVALAALLPIGAVVWVLGRRVRRANRALWGRLGDLSSQAAGLADAVPLLRAYGAEPRAIEEIGRIAGDIERGALRAERWAALAGPVVQLLGALSLVGAILIAGPRLVDGSLAPATFVSFFAAMFFVYRPVQSLGARAHQIASGLAALDRVAEVLDLEQEPADPPDARDLAPIREAIELSGVRFGYRTGEAVLDGVDLAIRAGESVAVVGPSGGGKTTLVMVLLGLLRADEGRVAIDGVDVRDVTRASWRRQFAWVTQEPLIFHDTVIANVTLAEPEPDGGRVSRALAMAGATELVAQLPNGLDTVLGEGGRDLSAGQRQRLCIARALYRDAPVLVFDEATSSLDGPSERAIGETIVGLMGERTVIVISHQARTVWRAERAVVIEGGRVVEAGSPEELWKTEGRFHALFRDEDLIATELTPFRTMRALA